MRKLCDLKKRLSKIKNPCLWVSGGSDSTLLLEVMIAEKLNFSIIHFADGLSRQQSKAVDELTIKHSLRIYSYPARFHVVVGNENGELAAISGYAVGKRGETMSLFRDIVEGERCAFDVPAVITPMIHPPIGFDNYVIGTKAGESHWALDGKPFLTKRSWEVGGRMFHAPLYSWSNAEVIAALKTYGIDWQTPSDELDTGNVAACFDCLKGTGRVYCRKEKKEIDSIGWNPLANLAKFREMSGV
jgi:hypothetical protein